jgi:uncharacterized protein with PIN domain
VYSSTEKYPLKKICSNCGKILQIVDHHEGKEIIESRVIVYYQVDLIYFCQECYKKERKDLNNES